MAVYTTIDNPELYFQVKTYTGTGSSNAITLALATVSRRTLSFSIVVSDICYLFF